MNQKSESLINDWSGASNTEALWMAINSAKVVSFDFFDTLFVRPLTDPEDAFDIVGNQFDLPDFRKLRCKAQADAFRQMIRFGKKEITLNDIYANITGLMVPNDKLMQAEYDLEKNLLVPNGELFSIFKKLIAQGKIVVITSDMYLDEAFFRQVLLKHQIQDIPLFISSVRNATKRDSGELFNQIINTYNISPQDILHIGDNYLSDVQKPREKKLAAFHYQPAYARAKKTPQSLMSSIAEGMLHTISAEKIPENSLQELGFKYLAPAVWAFLSWIAEQSQTDGIDKVLFISRDGYIPERVARRYFGSRLPQFCYFQGSRTAFHLALIDELNYNQNINFLMSAADGLTVSELLERIGLEAPLQSILADLGFPPGGKIGPENYPQVVKFLSAYRKEILKICRQNRRGLFIYLKSMGIVPGSKVAVVDIGWSGSTQEAFELAVANLMDISVMGYYFCLADTLECRRRKGRQAMKALISSESTSLSLVDNVYENRLLIELFFSAPHNTIIGYMHKGTTVTAVEYPGLIVNKDHNELINQLNTGVDVFLEYFNRLRKDIRLVISPIQQVRPLIEYVNEGQWRSDERFVALEYFDSWGRIGN